MVLVVVKYILSTQPGLKERAEYGVGGWWEMRGKRMERENIKIFPKDQYRSLITGQTLVY